MVIILIIDDAPHHVPALTDVPHKDELVRYDTKLYMVGGVIYNLDIEEVTVHLTQV